MQYHFMCYLFLNCSNKKHKSNHQLPSRISYIIFCGQEMKNQKVKPQPEQILDSFCEVCFVPFNKVKPRKLDEGDQVCVCVKCHCRVHKCCYDLELNSTFVTENLREFVCQRCDQKDLADKACIVCHRKDGVLRKIGEGEVVHVFCGLLHKDIMVTGYFPEVNFKKAETYKQVRHVCGLCSKPNATDRCEMQSCFRKYHAYCILLNLKQKQIEEADPQCEKHYLSSGDNGKFDLTDEIMPRTWVYEQFDKVLQSFEEYGFTIPNKQKLKGEVYAEYQKQQKQNKDESTVKRGGFFYILCKDHELSVYCNCFNKGSGDMVQCECCFQWYHQKCVNYVPLQQHQNFICAYCRQFYDLKKKIIDEVRSSRTEQYELKLEPPKMHLNDYMWLLRVIDHRIAGGAAAKMVKQLAKYPLKTSKMELVIRNQNKKKILSVTDSFVEKYINSEEHAEMLKPKPVLGLDRDQKPIVLHENVEYNRRLKKYVDFIQGYVKKNALPDFIGPLIHELKFKQRALDESYENILELSKSAGNYAEIPILKMKVQEYSFMEVIKGINSGSIIEFEDLQSALHKATTSGNIPSYLVKPLEERYQKVKSLVEFINEGILRSKQSSPQIESAIKKLKEENIAPPKIYNSFLEQKRFIKELYLFYLKQEGKPLQQSLDTSGKIQILANEPACKPNREIAECVNSFSLGGNPVHSQISQIVDKYSRLCISFQLRDYLRKQSIKLSVLENLFAKYTALRAEQMDLDTGNFMQGWARVRAGWINIKGQVEASISELDDIVGISTAIKHIQETIQSIAELPVEITDKVEEVPELGSLNRLEQLKSWLDSLNILYTESQLKKNPLTLPRLPEGLPKDNSLVKQYLSLKKEQNELQSEYNSILARMQQKIETLKNDPKKPRKEQMKDNLEKPRLTDVNNFIDQLKQSRVNMEAQIKELTRCVNRSIEIGSKVNKFIAEQRHLQSIFKQEQADMVRRQIDELRKKVLLEAEISLENELKELYQAEICIRMQKMIITSNAELDKMSKLLKFAEEEGLNHLATYKRLRAKFEIGNESTKEINQTKRHEQILESAKLKEGDAFYSSIVNVRKSLPLSIPQVLKQKNKHYEDLLLRNQYLKKKIEFILNEEPKKYDIEEAKVVYLEALKHPFEIEGLNKLINEFQKAERLLNIWRSGRQQEDSKGDIFIKYDNLIFNIQQIETQKKVLCECERILNKVKQLRRNNVCLQSLWKVQQGLEIVDQLTLAKTSKIYHKFKLEYYMFWISLLDKFKEDKKQQVPYHKIKSILYDIYASIQRNYRSVTAGEDLKDIVNYFEDVMVGIRNYFVENKGNVSNNYAGFIDLQELKYQISTGLDVREQIKILNPYNDINKFYSLDLQKTYGRTPNEETMAARRPRPESYEMDDPYNRESKSQKIPKLPSQSEIKAREESEAEQEEWEKNEGTSVSEAQRAKAKQIILKNIRKNPQLSGYENLSEQVKLIENQLFGDHHNQVVKYFQLVNSFQKLFIKLIGCPNISNKMAKKKFEWNFLKLLIESLSKIGQIQKMFAEKNKQASGANPISTIVSKKEEKKEQKEGKKESQEPKTKQKSIQQMLATGQVDEQTRKEMKKEVKAIRDKIKKKKNRSGKRRSRSRSRSKSSEKREGDAKFSSDSEENQLPVFIQKEYIETVNKPYFDNDIYSMPKPAVSRAIRYEPELEEEEREQKEKKNFAKGTVLQLRTVDLQLTLKKKSKMSIKGAMMSLEDYSKISLQLVDPGFSTIQLKRDKPEAEIIQYLNKPSRKKYKFLVGWFEAEDRDGNEALREFANECNERKKIFGIQNDHIKMHIMSIHQYVKIMQLFPAPSKASTERAAQSLSKDRLVFVVQYPSERMFELQGIFQGFTNVEGKSTGFDVEVPQAVIAPLPMERAYPPMPYSMGYPPMIVPEPPKVADNNLLKSVEYEGWGTSETIPVPPPQSYPMAAYSGSNPLNSLGRFSPILTDEEDNPVETRNQKKLSDDKEIDLASNILNSLDDVNIKAVELPPITRNYAMEEEQNRFDGYNRFQPGSAAMQAQMPPLHHQPPRWQPQMMPPPQMPMGRLNMPYNPMSVGSKYPPPPPANAPSMMYKNPMMPMGGFGYGQPMMPMPPQGGQPMQPGSQQSKPGSQPYDPYMYQRQ